jgi:hypothetical protein
MDVVIGIDTGTTATKAVAAGLGADVNAARKLTPFRPAATRGHFSGGADSRVARASQRALSTVGGGGRAALS